MGRKTSGARERILIKPDRVFYESLFRRRRKPLSEFLARLSRKLYWQTPLLPGPGTRLYAEAGGTVLVVFEEEPGLRTIHLNYEEEEGYFTLAFPYVVFLVKMGQKDDGFYRYSLSVYFRTESLKSMGDHLLIPCLSNLEEGGRRASTVGRQVHQVCQHGMESDKDVSALTKKVVSAFWQQTFTGERAGDDYVTVYRTGAHKIPRLMSFEAWQKASQRQPDFPLKVRWVPTKFTLGKAVEELIKKHEMPLDFLTLERLFWEG